MPSKDDLIFQEITKTQTAIRQLAKENLAHKQDAEKVCAALNKDWKSYYTEADKIKNNKQWTPVQ